MVHRNHEAPHNGARRLHEKPLLKRNIMFISDFLTGTEAAKAGSADLLCSCSTTERE
jgi:hypothetical protein